MKCSVSSTAMATVLKSEPPPPWYSSEPLMDSGFATSSAACMGCIIGCTTASCCELAAGAAASWQTSWFAAANFFCENFTKMFYNFCLIGKLIFYGKYDIIYIERKLRRKFICYTDKEVRIFLKKFFKNPLTFPPFYAII